MTSAFRHDALFYDSVGDLLDRAVPFVRDGVRAGQPVMVALVEERLRPLEAALGDDAGAVRFVDMRVLGANPARILPEWRAFVDGAAGKPARGIGEPVWPGRDDDEVDECMRHERLLNVAFGDRSPFELLCPYDARAFGDDLLTGVRRCHGPEAHVGNTFEGELPPAPARAARLTFTRSDLPAVRAFAGACGREAGLAPERVLDLALALSELAANSAHHGGGRGTARIWVQPGSLVCEVADHGRIEDRLAGRRAPDLDSPGGRGLWIVNQIADLVRIRSGEGGTTVRLHLNRT